MSLRKTLLLLFCASFFLFFIFFKEEVIFNVQKNFFNPCSSPITYTIGVIDPGFNLTENDFLLIVNEAANEWNNAMGKELFKYGDGGMKINLVYDYRQETTIKLDNIDYEHRQDADYYYQLVDRYNEKIDLYNSKKIEVETIIDEYNKRSSNLQKDILLWTKSKRNNNEEYDRLNQEKQFLENIAFDIKKKQEELNQIYIEINSLVSEINKIATKLNINVDEYNLILDNLSDRFEQGNYVSRFLFREINIYQFEDKESLLQVLIHELGHALGLEHTMDSSDVMYFINTDEKQMINESSLNQLRDICYE
jgi:hypothetical protein